ncbi:MAG TPA: TIGR02265 family protein [Polyangiaceae bacterium]|nr:TIGR02265 family protein [Polyangiaceae bacterium]
MQPRRVVGDGVEGVVTEPHARALALVAPHCDIVDRLPLVPPSARIRGIYFNAIEKQLGARGRLDAYRAYFPEGRFGALSFHPVREYLVRMACAGALVASPERIHDGMLLIAKGNARAFMESVLGRLMLRVLSGDRRRLVEQAVAGRRQSVNYGHWELVPLGDRAFEVVYEEEYIWIESAIAGAGLGTFEACGLPIQTELRLVDRFNGSSVYTW